jgi:hypothetical protein
MCDHAEAAGGVHLCCDLAAARYRSGRARHADSRIVPLASVQFHAVDHQDARTIGRRFNRGRAVAVIGEDDEI